MTPVDQTKFSGPGSVGNCFPACVASITGIPLDEIPNFCERPEEWFADAMAWCALRGWALSPENDDELPDGKPCIASGPGPRGKRHSVVWMDGKMIHDSHPSRAGLVDYPEEFETLTEI